MKRIANKIAVQSICYLISGIQHVRIVDYDTDYDCQYVKNGHIVFDGMLNEQYSNLKATKYFNSECHGIRIENEYNHSVIVFDVFTKYEQY